MREIITTPLIVDVPVGTIRRESMEYLIYFL